MTQLLLVLAVGCAGGVGAGLRYLVDNALPERLRDRYPAGTMLINITGSFVLGCVTGMALGSSWMLVISTGLLGGYTTFSAAGVEAVRLLEQRRYLAAAVHGPGMLLVCLAVALLGLMLTGR